LYSHGYISQFREKENDAMKKGQIIWGVVCLVIAAGLAVLNVILPPEKLMFQLGGQNLPWVPSIMLAFVGIILLATAWQKEGPEIQEGQVKPGQDLEKAALNKRLELITWGFFLIMLGVFALVPGYAVPKGVWTIGIGVIMLGLNATRYFYKIKMSGLTTFLGIFSLAGGIAELLGVTSLDAALLLIILGAYLILKPWFDKKRIFGKAEEA
jgi:hypothetical protein